MPANGPWAKPRPSHAPRPYSSEWVALPEPYLRAVAAALNERGARVLDFWNDPIDPRDATILLREGTTGGLRLVWDEESGWRYGPMDGDGWPLWERYLPYGPLPRPRRIAEAVVGVLRGTVAGDLKRPTHRSFRDYHDGFDTRLMAYTRTVTRAT